MTTENPQTVEEIYFRTRVDDQIDWYDKKSGSNKRMFLTLKLSEIILSMFIPFLTAYISNTDNVFKIIVGFLGIAIAAIAGIITLVKFQENWIEYRSVVETLKFEKFLFLTHAGPYKNNATAFTLFVERFENTIASSTKKWVTYVSQNDGDEAAEQPANPQ